MRNPYTLAPLAVALALLAGCGSSSKSTTTTAGTTAAASGTTSNTSSTSSSSAGAGYAGRGYGSGSSSAATTSSSAGSGVLVTTKTSKLGTILAAGPKKLTVYLFEGDKGPSSSCSSACASAWPPVTSTSAPSVGGAAMSAHLGTITRADGSKQVTYNGHPLYYFVRDKDAGDAYGQGVDAFGAGWYVLAPGGNKIDHS